MGKTCRKTVRIANRLGLHARPAMLFTETASRFGSSIRVQRLDDRATEADGKSIMQMMVLAATQHTEIEIIAVGPDADEAVAALDDLVRARFHEEE